VGLRRPKSIAKLTRPDYVGIFEGWLPTKIFVDQLVEFCTDHLALTLDRHDPHPTKHEPEGNPKDVPPVVRTTNAEQLPDAALDLSYSGVNGARVELHAFILVLRERDDDVLFTVHLREEYFFFLDKRDPAVDSRVACYKVDQLADQVPALVNRYGITSLNGLAKFPVIHCSYYRLAEVVRAFISELSERGST